MASQPEHLTRQEIEACAEGVDIARAGHLAECPLCRAIVDRELRLTRALAKIPRTQMPRGLVARVLGALPSPGFNWSPVWRGFAASLAVVAALVLVVETAGAMQFRGTWDLIGLYISRPEILTGYPRESLAALTEMLPWGEFVLTTLALTVAGFALRGFATSVVSPSSGWESR